MGIPAKRTVKRMVQYLYQDELEAILDVPDRSTPQGRRDYALLLFLGRTGARVSEAIGVHAAALHLERPWQVELYGKRSKERTVPLGEDIAVVLREFLDYRGLAAAAAVPVFVNAHGERLTRYGVIHILRRAVSYAIKTKPSLGRIRISPHTLRHTTAMHLLQSGVDLTTIRSWLGHVNLSTTHDYIEADVEMKRRALDKCDNSEAKASRYTASDKLLDFLDNL